MHKLLDIVWHNAVESLVEHRAKHGCVCVLSVTRPHRMQSMRMRPTVNLLPMLCGLRVICLSDTTFSPTKTVKLIQVLCWVETQIGPGNHLLDGYPGKGAISASAWGSKPPTKMVPWANVSSPQVAFRLV